MAIPVLGLDLSFSRTTAQWWINRRADGFRVCSQCLWTGGLAGFDGIKIVAEDNLRFARQAGFETSGYLNAAPEDWWADSIAIARAKECAGTEWDHVEVMVVDWEIPNTPYSRAVSLGDALTLEGKRAAILYTRTGIIGNTDTQRFALWLAQFDEDTNLGSVRLTYREGGIDKPIGPHGAIAGKQWRNTHTVEGVTIDADTFDLAMWEDDNMPLSIDDKNAIRQLCQEALQIELGVWRTIVLAEIAALKAVQTGSGASADAIADELAQRLKD